MNTFDSESLRFVEQVHRIDRFSTRRYFWGRQTRGLNPVTTDKVKGQITVLKSLDPRIPEDFC